MLDRYLHALVQPLLEPPVRLLKTMNIRPNHLTWTGFIVGCFCIPALILHAHLTALGFILINRILDGLDGTLARLLSPTDHGGFLDITLDFIFYPMVVLGFIFENPATNGMSGAFLLFAFMCAATAFLAFAIMAAKNRIPRIQFKNKSMYYMSGITEGAETILFFILICLFPHAFPALAWTYGGLCLVTAGSRIYTGTRALKYM